MGWAALTLATVTLSSVRRTVREFCAGCGAPLAGVARCGYCLTGEDANVVLEVLSPPPSPEPYGAFAERAAGASERALRDRGPDSMTRRGYQPTVDLARSRRLAEEQAEESRRAAQASLDAFRAVTSCFDSPAPSPSPDPAPSFTSGGGGDFGGGGADGSW